MHVGRKHTIHPANQYGREPGMLAEVSAAFSRHTILKQHPPTPAASLTRPCLRTHTLLAATSVSLVYRASSFSV